MIDFGCNDRRAFMLLEMIFETENEIIKSTSKYDFDAVIFYDGWGMQKDIMISLDMWKKVFKPLYKKQFEKIHDLGMHVFFHSCGDITSIIKKFHEIGVDVINMDSPM
jgi:uroporphyrinogen decarboxylase